MTTYANMKLMGIWCGRSVVGLSIIGAYRNYIISESHILKQEQYFSISSLPPSQNFSWYIVYEYNASNLAAPNRLYLGWRPKITHEYIIIYVIGSVVLRNLPAGGLGMRLCPMENM